MHHAFNRVEIKQVRLFMSFLIFRIFGNNGRFENLRFLDQKLIFLNFESCVCLVRRFGTELLGHFIKTNFF